MNDVLVDIHQVIYTHNVKHVEFEDKLLPDAPTKRQTASTMKHFILSCFSSRDNFFSIIIATTCDELLRLLVAGMIELFSPAAIYTANNSITLT